MSRFRVSDQAQEDLEQIWLYIAQDGPRAADRLAATLLEKFHTLVGQPGIGAAREELAPSLRGLPVGNYIIFYRPTEDGIEVVRVLSGYRDLDRLFER